MIILWLYVIFKHLYRHHIQLIAALFLMCVKYTREDYFSSGSLVSKYNIKVKTLLFHAVNVPYYYRVLETTCVALIYYMTYKLTVLYSLLYTMLLVTHIINNIPTFNG